MTEENFYVKKIPQSVYRKRHQQEKNPDKQIDYKLKKLNLSSKKEKEAMRKQVIALYESVCDCLFTDESRPYVSKDDYLEKTFKALGI